MASLATGAQAHMYAQAGLMRAGESRANYTSPRVFVAIDGVQVATARAVDTEKVLDDTLTITEQEGETPNTAVFQVQGFEPTAGQDVVITLGSINNLDRLFAGVILYDTHGYVGTPANGIDEVSVIDYSWHFTRRTISRRWTNATGTTIARTIIAEVPGFTALLVEDDLPVLEEFTVTDKTCAAALGALCRRLGAHYKVTYHKDVWLGLTTNPTHTDPMTLTEATALLTGMTGFRVRRDLSPVITQQPVEGGGSTALAETAAGETILPVADPVWYNANGGLVASGPQVIAYTGLTEGGTGSLVGPSAAPVAAPTGARTTGGSLTLGDHQWAYVWGTAAGTSLPSPLSAVQTAVVYTPPTPAAPSVTATPQSANFSAGTLVIGSSYTYKAVFSTTTSGGANSLQSAPSNAAVTVVSTNNPAKASPLWVTVTIPADPLIRFIRWYRSENGGAWTPAGITDASVTGNSYQDLGSTAGGAYAGSTAETYQTVNLTGIAVGPAGTTYREVYQTAAGGAQLKLQQTIANNTATTATASAADAALGANAPITDTSGLTPVSGNVLAGATALPTPGAGPFDAAGGWVIIGQQVVRYTGITGNTLTGIPASGAGAITTTVPYGSQVVAAPALTGIPASGASAILYAIQAGDPVNLRVILEDLDAQAGIAARLGSTDGIIVGDLIQDGRISETEARARGRAVIITRSAIEESISYQTHDKNTRAGRTISVDLPAPTSVTASFKVQRVTIRGFSPSILPTRRVEASSRRVSLEALVALFRKIG